MSRQRYGYSEDIESVVDNGVELTIQDVVFKLNQHDGVLKRAVTCIEQTGYVSVPICIEMEQAIRKTGGE